MLGLGIRIDRVAAAEQRAPRHAPCATHTPRHVPRTWPRTCHARHCMPRTHLAPMTSTTSEAGRSSLISSISSTTSYGTPASASNTLSCPGMRPATGWMAKRTLHPCARSLAAISATAYLRHRVAASGA
eukprot:scaffold7232_cov63-Phaeocystis_antarctica.AAC.2